MKRAIFCMTIAVTACLISVQGIAADKELDFKAVGVDGKEYSLTKTTKDAKATVVCFTCNRCPVAVAYEDRFIEFAEKYKEKGVKFVAINVNTSEDLEAMKQRAEEKGFSFPYTYDASGDSARAFGARVTPHLFLLDGSGELAYEGAFDDNMTSPTKFYLADAVDAVLDGKAPAVAKTRAIGCGIRPKRN